MTALKVTKEKKRNPGSNIKISDEGYQVVFDYCKANDLVIRKFVEKVLLEKVNALNKRKK